MDGVKREKGKGKRENGVQDGASSSDTGPGSVADLGAIL
jgi:hypothetical protein